jgi:hypothetical protein
MRWVGRTALALACVAAVGAAAACSSATDGRASQRAGAVALPNAHSTAPGSVSSSSTTVAPPAAPPARSVRTPCDRNERHKFVFVDLHRQHMWMCGRHRVVADTSITSGMAGAYTHTPTGRYRIQGLNRDSTLTLNTGATYVVKYWIPFDAPLFGFHDSSWQRFPYGSPKYKTAGSHGCVHMPLRAIRFLYGWADVGTPVRIRQ